MSNYETSDTMPIKLQEYEEFVGMLEEGIPIHSWSNIANDLNVSRDTITEWKKTPRAIAAVKKAVKRALSKMQEVGSDDWRMWREYNKLLGIDAVDKHEIVTKNEIVNLDNLTDDKIGQLKTILDEAGTTKGDLQE